MGPVRVLVLAPLAFAHSATDRLALADARANRVDRRPLGASSSWHFVLMVMRRPWRITQRETMKKICIIVFIALIGTFVFGSEIQATIITTANKPTDGMILSLSGFGEKGDYQVRSRILNGKISFIVNNDEMKVGYISIDNPKYRNWNFAIAECSKIRFGPKEKIDIGAIYISEKITIHKNKDGIIWNDDSIITLKYVVLIYDNERINNDKRLIPQLNRLINVPNSKVFSLQSICDIPIINESEIMNNLDNNFQVVRNSDMDDCTIMVKSYVYNEASKKNVYVSESDYVVF
jgi:hypothetical protein